MTAAHKDSHVEPGEKAMSLTSTQIEVMRELFTGGPYSEQVHALCDMALRAAEAEKDAARYRRIFAYPFQLAQWDAPPDEGGSGFQTTLADKAEADAAIDAALSPPQEGAVSCECHGTPECPAQAPKQHWLDGIGWVK